MTAGGGVCATPVSAWPEEIAVSSHPDRSEKGFVPLALLCMFFGWLGIHRFYAGKIGTGILMLLTLGGFGIWQLVDTIIIMTGGFRDKSGLRILMAPVPNESPKDFVPLVLLCFFFGVLGIHRFYVGKIGTGILMLLTLGGFGIWLLIDMIVIACGGFRDKQGLLIRQSMAS